MTRRRRCQVCRSLFEPDARVGKRQTTCSAPTCQRERHRRNCAEWRQREQEAVEEEGIRRRIGVPEGEIRLAAVRDECGAKVKVVVEECLRFVSLASRDEFRTKHVDQGRDCLRLVDRPPRDERDRARAPP